MRDLTQGSITRHLLGMADAPGVFDQSMSVGSVALQAVIAQAGV